jgi:D-alanyl-D-alanine carboxypeptidase
LANIQKVFKHIDTFIGLWMKQSGVPGMTVALTDREKLLKLSAYGFIDLAGNTPVIPDTLFEIGSLGKPFTSIALLQLHEEGKLDLHAPVSDYLPWFQVQTDYRPITVHNLMNHTAGIVRGTDLAPHGLYESWALRYTRATAPPGEYFSYSNIGYKTLGFLLERLTGQPLSEIIRTRVLNPLGMSRTHPTVTTETRKKSAVGYCGIYDDRPEHISHALVPAVWSEYSSGDGCEASTAEDMAVYLRMLLNRGQTSRGRLISEDSFDRMTANGIWTGGDYYGYGLATYPEDGRTYIGHGGGNAGFRSAIVVDMEAGFGVVFLLNRMGETDPVVEAAQYVLTVIRNAVLNEVIPPLPRLPEPGDVKNAEDYTGTYRSGNKTLDIVIRNRKLNLDYRGRLLPLEQRAPDSFYIFHPDFDLFLLDFKREKGRVVEAFHGPDWYVNDRYSGNMDFNYPGEWKAFPGHYRTRSPELSNFRVVLRKGSVTLIIPWGNTEPLVSLGNGLFRIGEDPKSPETLRFDTVVEGRALRVDYSGCPFYRTFTP